MDEKSSIAQSSETSDVYSVDRITPRDQPDLSQTSAAVRASVPWYTPSIFVDYLAVMMQPVSRFTYCLLDTISGYFDRMIEDARESATELTRECSSYFPKNAPHY